MNTYLFLVFFAFSSMAPALTVVGTANRAGELEPCGCQVNQVGGINRMAEWISTQRKFTEVVVLDAGDTFFSAPILAPSRQAMERLRALTIADAYKEMGVQLMLPGERDLALGLEFLKELGKRSGVKFVVTNLKRKLGEEFVSSEILKTKEGTVGVIGVVSEEVFGGAVEMEDPVESLQSALEELRSKDVKKVVVLSHLGLVEDKKLAGKFKDVLIIGAHSLDPVVFTDADTKSVVLQTQHEGQQLGVRVDGLVKLIDLSTDWDKENKVSQIVRHYHEVRGIAKANERVVPLAATGKSPYVANPQKCKSCHETQYSFWENTKHSSSILALYAKRQHLDTECIACHSLGYKKPGGFQSTKEGLRFSSKKGSVTTFLEEVFKGEPEGTLDSRREPERHQKLHRKYHDKLNDEMTAKRIRQVYWGTQCEHCHGNRNGHPGIKATQKKVTAETCIQCHRAPNAPEFDLSMIAKVACPVMDKRK